MKTMATRNTSEKQTNRLGLRLFMCNSEMLKHCLHPLRPDIAALYFQADPESADDPIGPYTLYSLYYTEAIGD